jgi:hypothetical protein
LILFFKGKYVEIQFSRGGEPIGGVISNFLLEKVSQIKMLSNIHSNTIALISLQKKKKDERRFASFFFKTYISCTDVVSQVLE